MKKLIWLIIAGCCALASTVATAITTEEPRKFDEYEDICCGDEKSRLDNFAHHLRENPDATGYIIYYGGRRYPSCWYARSRRRGMFPYKGEAEDRASIFKLYLMEVRGFKPERIVVVHGGYRQSWTAELWIVPKGTRLPMPTPTLKPEDIRYGQGKSKKRVLYERCNEG